MQHICRWNGHREHFSEKTHVFYKRFSKILAFSRLVSVIKILFRDVDQFIFFIYYYLKVYSKSK
jgi:hypothetical protein